MCTYVCLLGPIFGFVKLHNECNTEEALEPFSEVLCLASHGLERFAHDRQVFKPRGEADWFKRVPQAYKSNKAR